MATDILTTIQTNVRASLAGTGTTFPDAMVDAAIFEVVADISRLAPRELVHIEILHSRTVSAVTTPALTDVDTWYDIQASGNLFPIDQQAEVVVTSDPAGTTFTKHTDYIIDYVQARIQRITGGAMTATTFLVTYERSLKGIDLSSLTDFISIDRVEIAKQGVSFQDFTSFWQWGDILWLQARDGTEQGNLAEDDHVRIWYKGEHTKPGASAGSYPAYLDDIVTKGAVAYALFSKHRERNLQAVSDLATSRTQLALADDDQTAINTLETAVTTALDSAKTSVALADALADTPLGDAETALDAAITALASATTALGTTDAIADTILADIETALDAVITQLGTEAETLLDAVAFTGMNTSIESALDGAAALLDETSSDVKTALGKVVEHLETDTTNPDSAEAQLAAGDSLINASNLGADAAALYARYAEAQVLISGGFVGEANALIAQAQGQIAEASLRVQQKQVYLGEVDRRITIASTYIAEARERIGISNVVIQVTSGYVAIAGTYVVEARERLGIAASLHEAAVVYVQEATGRMQQIDRHLALGALYINQARGYQEAADRENASADRFLFDAQERHRDYWEHIQRRVEMSWPNQRQAAVRQNA